MPQGSHDVSGSRVSVPQEIYFPVSGHTRYAPPTCIAHVRDFDSTIYNKDRNLMSKLGEKFLNYMRQFAM